QLIAKPHVPVPGGKGHYGYGLTMAKIRGVSLIEHGGARSGYGSVIRFLPEQKTAIILLVNKSGGSLPLTMEVVTALLIAPNVQEKKLAATPGKPPLEVDNLVGTYSN